MTQEITVFSNPHRKGYPLKLSAPVGKGGEGAVYAKQLDDGKEIAIKVFSQKKLEKGGKFLSEKIGAMLEMGSARDRELILHPNIAWPQMLVYGESGDFVGYAMRRAKGATLDKLAHPKLYQKYFKDMDRVKLARMLIKLLMGADCMHRRYIRIGDVNLKNVLCDEGYNPCWIDVDSYQIGVNDESDESRAPEIFNLLQTQEENKASNALLKPRSVWHCPVGRPEMTAPEHQGKNYADYDRTYASDLFSLAILVFQCMMLGRHPYDATGGGTPVENLRKGHFPYGKGGSRPGKPGSIPAGPWYKIWSHYTYDIKTQFINALRNGAHDSSVRPTLHYDWIPSLRHYEKTLAMSGEDEHSKEMIPVKAKSPDLPYRGKPEKS